MDLDDLDASAQARAPELARGVPEFVGGRLTLEGDQDAVGREQRGAPADEPGEGGERPGRHDVVALRVVLGPRTHDPDALAEPEFLDDLGEERGASEQGLEQGQDGGRPGGAA